MKKEEEDEEKYRRRSNTLMGMREPAKATETVSNRIMRRLFSYIIITITIIIIGGRKRRESMGIDEDPVEA